MLPKAFEDTLGYNLYRTSLLFRRELAGALSAFDLTPEQWQIIVALGNATVRQTDLTGATLKDKPTISRMLRRMERNGWVERLPDVDRRVRRVRLTTRGYGLRKDVLLGIDAHLGRRLQPMSGDERRSLLCLLKQLRQVLED